jgi:hypothetical protein
MNEANLRKWHRRLGLVSVLFIVLQTLSGLLLNLEDLFEIRAVTVWSNVIHRGAGDFGTVYRTFLGVGLLGMGVTGGLIYFKFWQRTRKKHN